MLSAASFDVWATLTHYIFDCCNWKWWWNSSNYDNGRPQVILHYVCFCVFLSFFSNLQTWYEERGNYIKDVNNVRETIFQSRSQLTWMCKFKRFVVRCKLPSGIAGVFPVGLATHGWATSPETPIWKIKKMPHAVWLSAWPASCQKGGLKGCVCVYSESWNKNNILMLNYK